MRFSLLTTLALSTLVSAVPQPSWWGPDPPEKYDIPPATTDANWAGCYWEKHLFGIGARYTIMTEGPWTHPNATFLANEVKHSCKLRKGNWKWTYGPRGEGEGAFLMWYWKSEKCVEEAIDKAIWSKPTGWTDGIEPAVKCVKGKKENPMFNEWHIFEA